MIVKPDVPAKFKWLDKRLLNQMYQLSSSG